MKFRNVLSVMLVLSLLFVTPTPVFASGTVHECTYETWTSYEYSSFSSSLHEVNTIKYYDCTGQNCPIMYSEIVSTSYESHHYEYVWNGEEYHSGSLHYGYYVPECSSCKYIDYDSGEWRSWDCPGGICRLPWSLRASVK